MKDLIERLEAAAEGSRELDAEIAREVGTAPEEGPAPYAWHFDGWDFYRAEAADAHVPMRRWGLKHYTTSLDAALSLVPEEWTAWALNSTRRKRSFTAELSRLTECDSGEDWRHASASTPALALAIAALKARVSP